jgi:hypothetical protein
MDRKELERPIVASKRGNGPYRAPWSEGGAALWAQRRNHAASDPPASPTPVGAPTESGPTNLKSGSNLVPSEREPDQSENSSPDVEAIDEITQAVWGEDRSSAGREPLSDTGRPSGSSHDSLATVRLIDSLSPWSLPLNRIQFSSDHRKRAGLPLCFETGNDEPDVAIKSLVVATIATEWLHACRWNRDVRPGRPRVPTDSHAERPRTVGNPIRRRRVVLK